MKHNTRLFAIILGISCLCGCSKQSDDEGPNPHMEVTYDVMVNQGYYLSDGDDSYIVIKYDKISVVGVDWAGEYRKSYPRLENQTESEYEKEISDYVQRFIDREVAQPFITLKWVDWPESWTNRPPYLQLVTNATEEMINNNTRGAKSVTYTMLDENTIRNDENGFLYVYCGTSLPESE